ncbi:glycoside hydrolase [Actinoplanes capillaceus]|uniref:Glycoside hydrolase n=1 Tax=Actinoplanes campanulatus TaxID=113559 RepID=A0ABQ3WYT9_9ACTN|nr:glycosyltransferase family 4 protein [Actinoplanes capillaceus]GID51433.1 glycoside hydrolase [Actinoplanes capillaceus]
MRVALVHRDLHQITRGGICTVYLALADELAGQGHEVVLITQDTPHPVQRTGVQVVTLPRTEDMVAHRAAVAAAVDLVEPDIAECSTWEAELLAYARQPRHAPILVRGDLSAATMGAGTLAVDEQALCEVAQTVVAVSEFAADDLSRAYRIPRPAVIPNGVDRSRFCPQGSQRPASGWRVQLDTAGRVVSRRPLTETIATDPRWAAYFDPAAGGLPRLVWVGKFTEMKGYDRLEAVAAALHGRARLLILLGHGQVHYPVDLPDGVLICQDLDPADVPALYRRADFLLSTSRWEGYGLAIAEALACGTPALLPADLAVASELITAGTTGHLWTSAAQVEQLIGQCPALTGRLPEQYSWQANAASTMLAYQTLTAGRQR